MTKLSYQHPCDPVEQLATQERLDALYEADGRDSLDHPMHALYTGLHMQNAQKTA